MAFFFLLRVRTMGEVHTASDYERYSDVYVDMNKQKLRGP
jgi:hypothetical protein